MKTTKNRARKQLILISFLFVIFIMTIGLIYLGSTVFRSQLPFFQLIDSKDEDSVIVGPEPTPNEGVIDFETDPSVSLYMVLGSDYRPQSGFRTDVLLLIALDKSSGRMSFVSFPRDLWVTIPGYGEQRINVVMQTGGFQLLADTLQYNFGVYPTQYAMIDMEGFIDVIDVLGGISFETDSYTADACEKELDPDKWCEVGPGMVTLDSQWALWYVRARYNSSDFDRMRRTQEVVKAVIDKVVSPAGLLKIPDLTRIYDTEVESNINPDQIFVLSQAGLNFNSDQDIRRFTIGPEVVTSWTTPDGGAVLLPHIEAIQGILQEALNFESVP
ncbi:MAG: LytR family transcriptional protein [Anaerolineaceae bacterium 46_22]|nr:MAG: LytR family transcriptional protein [Anaerolineaceae bacterium 46_22]